MGKSAKLHKRVPKKLKSSAQSSTHTAPTPIQTQIQNAQKKASRKSKLGKGKGGKSEGPVLGGADYVTLMLGGRRKAEEEAKKLYDLESTPIS